jgi:purine-binding chemotaxis protein CheW
MELPSSGLAEDILAQFIDTAQVEASQTMSGAQRDQGEAILHLVTFQLGREEYGIEIANVQEIIRAADITPVPGAQAHVRGVINLRGRIIPVVDLRIRFSLPLAEVNDAQRIIVVEVGHKRIGMLVDSVSQVLRIPEGIVEEMPEEVVSLEADFIRGVGKLDNRLIIILDLDRSILHNGC